MRGKALLLIVSLAAGCATSGPEVAAGPTIATRAPRADDAPDLEPQPEGVQPASGPLAEMAQALEEAERESERAAELEAQLTRALKHAAELQAALEQAYSGRKARAEELVSLRAELRQTMGRLVDAEMARVRAEQELLRREIESEERAKLRREETSNG